MEQRQKYYGLVFAYQYMAAASVPLSLIAAFSGSGRGALFFVICLAVGYLAVRFRMKYTSKRERQSGREKRCHLSLLAAAIGVSAMLLVPPEYVEPVSDMGFVGGLLTAVWFVSAFALYEYAEYYREKYLTMYENPCVSRETIRRFEQNTKRAVRKAQIVFGTAVLLLVVLVCVFPGAEPQAGPKKKAAPQAEQKKIPAARSKAKPGRLREVNEKEKENRGFAWEMFLRVLRVVMRVVVILLVLLGIILLVYFLLRRRLRVRIPKYTRVSDERQTVTDGIDEYIPLPVSGRVTEGFSPDNNGKIRRYFYGYIRKRAGRGVDPSLTPYELAREYKADEGKLAAGETEAVAIYEKARYSGTPCGPEDVEKARRGFGR